MIKVCETSFSNSEGFNENTFESELSWEDFVLDWMGFDFEDSDERQEGIDYLNSRDQYYEWELGSIQTMDETGGNWIRLIS